MYFASHNNNHQSFPRRTVPDITGEIAVDWDEHTVYKLVDNIGQGAYGSIYKAIGPDLRSYAFKVMPVVSNHPNHWRTALEEFAVHEIVHRHPNVVSLHGIFVDRMMSHIRMDIARGGSLYDCINESDMFRCVETREENVRRVFGQVLDAVAYCHHMGVAHRDLKPENILCDEDAENVYLADFGLASDLRETTGLHHGSLHYLPPEAQVENNPHSEPFSPQGCDVWALGIVLCNILSSEYPWAYAIDDDKRYKAYLSKPTRTLLKTLPISVELARLLRKVLRADPKRRIGVIEFRSRFIKLERLFATEEEMRQRRPTAVRSVSPYPRAIALLDEDIEEIEHIEYSSLGEVPDFGMHATMGRLVVTQQQPEHKEFRIGAANARPPTPCPPKITHQGSHTQWAHPALEFDGEDDDDVDEDSEGPITPETNPMHGTIAVQDIPGLDLAEEEGGVLGSGGGGAMSSKGKEKGTSGMHKHMKGSRLKQWVKEHWPPHRKGSQEERIVA